MMGYDSPEMRTRDQTAKERAIHAREKLKTLLPTNVFLGNCNGLDKYGRLLLNLKYNGKLISNIMIESGHGYAYDGGRKDKVES